LCQEVIAKISLIDAEDTWQRFKDTTQLAIEIGRLQYYLERVDPNSRAEVIDAVWSPPAPTPASPTVPTPVNYPSSAMPSDLPSLISSVIPSYLPPSNPSSLRTTSPSALLTPFPLLDFLVENSFDGGDALNNTSSPQYMAYSWLLGNDLLPEYSHKQMLQRYSMATFYYATTGDQWLDNDFWLSDMSECSWFGKTGSRKRCNMKGELVNLELDLNNLIGSLPAELGLLSSALEKITLRGGPDTDIIGTLPTELGYLTQLKVFFVRNNDLSGTIPSEIGNWLKLKELDLSRNGFEGELPTQAGSFPELTFFEVSANSLSGNLPTELGQLKKCRKMYFEANAFLSSIPTEIGNLKQLEDLKGGNNVFYSLPTELGGLTSADIISFKGSRITGSIPTELGMLRKLRKF